MRPNSAIEAESHSSSRNSTVSGLTSSSHTRRSSLSTLSRSSSSPKIKPLDLHKIVDVLQTLKPEETLNAPFNDQFQNGSVSLRFSCFLDTNLTPVVKVVLLGNGVDDDGSVKNAECIYFTFHRRRKLIHLDSYYYEQRCSPLPITHEDFFNKLLKPIAELLGVKIRLDDVSTKLTKQCPSVPNFIFYLAKGLSFYQRFQFKNDDYTKFLDDLRSKTVEKAFKARFEYHANITKRYYKENYEKYPKRAPGIKIIIPYLQLRLLLKSLGMVRSTIKDIANYILKHCKGDAKFLQKDKGIPPLRLQIIKGDTAVAELASLLVKVLYDYMSSHYIGQHFWFYTPEKILA